MQVITRETRKRKRLERLQSNCAAMKKQPSIYKVAKPVYYFYDFCQSPQMKGQ